MGYWPGKLICFLKMIIMVGYGAIKCIIAGQSLSAVSRGTMSIVVGIIVTAIISWLVAVFGMAVFQTYERYKSLLTPSLSISLTLMAGRWAWIPQAIVLLVLVGIDDKNFNTS